MTKAEVLKSKVCLVGEKGVGKTSLIRRFVLDAFDDQYIRTLGAKVSKKALSVALPDRGVRLDVSMAIWDVIGHVGFRDLLSDAFFLGAQGILAVVDLTRRETLPACLEISAWTREGEIMGLRHRRQPLEGVQFHPESILTLEGKRLLGNFLKRLG